MNKPEIAIVGIGITKQAKSIDTSTIQICEEAVQKALDDAGKDMAEVDGIAARWPGPGGTELDPGVVDWTGIFGKPFRWVGDTYPQGIPGLLDAAAAVSFGLCNVAIVFGGQAGVLKRAQLADYTCLLYTSDAADE